MADYRDGYAQIRAAGASVAAVSVDTAEQSEALRAQLSLPFPILCDTERRVLKEWDLLNARERGGIAKPAVFVIDRGLVVRYAGVDRVAGRVPAAEMLLFLADKRGTEQIRRKIHMPLPGDWVRAIRNSLRKD